MPLVMEAELQLAVEACACLLVATSTSDILLVALVLSLLPVVVLLPPSVVSFSRQLIALTVTPSVVAEQTVLPLTMPLVMEAELQLAVEACACLLVATSTSDILLVALVLSLLPVVVLFSRRPTVLTVMPSVEAEQMVMVLDTVLLPVASRARTLVALGMSEFCNRLIQRQT
jgi:hypothetical protein